jgi:hypothetical protein
MGLEEALDAEVLAPWPIRLLGEDNGRAGVKPIG